MQTVQDKILFTEKFCTQSDLLTREQAAEYLGVTVQTLAVWACTKRYDLAYVKVGRLAKYRLSDLDAFIARRTVMQHQTQGDK